MSEEVRPFEEYKEMIKDMKVENVLTVVNNENKKRLLFKRVA